MKVAIGCAGIGAASTGDFIRRSAQAAERYGFSSYWLPEHVVRFGAYPESRHPYAEMFGGSSSMSDARVPFTDPIVGMAWAAAATSTIEIGSAIIILPQRNPVALAKERVSLDECSGGRIALGAGVGWCKERVARMGDGWLALNLPAAQARDRITRLKQITCEQGRDAEALRIMCPIFEATTRGELERYREAGGTEFYLLLNGTGSIDEQSLNSRMAALAERFVERVRRW